MAKAQMDHLVNPPKKWVEGAPAALAEPTTILCIAWAIKAATTKIKAATMTLGKYPRTTFFKKSFTWLRPSMSKEAIRKTIAKNHLTSPPRKWPELRVNPPLWSISSTPTDWKTLSTFNELIILSTNLPIIEATRRPRINTIIAIINLGANPMTPPQSFGKEKSGFSPKFFLGKFLKKKIYPKKTLG